MTNQAKHPETRPTKVTLGENKVRRACPESSRTGSHLRNRGRRTSIFAAPGDARKIMNKASATRVAPMTAQPKGMKTSPHRPRTSTAITSTIRSVTIIGTESLIGMYRLRLS
jgi:hypothetical protein